MHEEISNGLFDEINNVVDANRILARGQPHFFLGSPVYFRIYAERQHVRQADADVLLLLRSAVVDFYAPHAYWLLALPPDMSVSVFADLYLFPKNPHVHYLMRLAVLLGPEFAKWLFERWLSKWGNHPQPPHFYWTFKDMIKSCESANPVLVASRFAPTARIRGDGDKEVSVKELLGKPSYAATLLTRCCLEVFDGKTQARAPARNLDFLTYGNDLMAKGPALAKSIMNTVGRRKPRDVTDTNEQE